MWVVIIIYVISIVINSIYFYNECYDCIPINGTISDLWDVVCTNDDEVRFILSYIPITSPILAFVYLIFIICKLIGKIRIK